MLIQFALTLDLIYEILFLNICLIGTQGNEPATKTTRQDSLFTSKHSEIGMISESCVEPTQGGISYAGKILFFINIF